MSQGTPTSSKEGPGALSVGSSRSRWFSSCLARAAALRAENSSRTRRKKAAFSASLCLARAASRGLWLATTSAAETAEAGEATSPCKASMHISDMQQQASAAEWAASHPHRHAG